VNDQVPAEEILAEISRLDDRIVDHAYHRVLSRRLAASLEVAAQQDREREEEK